MLAVFTNMPSGSDAGDSVANNDDMFVIVGDTLNNWFVELKLSLFRNKHKSTQNNG